MKIVFTENAEQTKVYANDGRDITSDLCIKSITVCAEGGA